MFEDSILLSLKGHMDCGIQMFISALNLPLLFWAEEPLLDPWLWFRKNQLLRRLSATLFIGVERLEDMEEPSLPPDMRCMLELVLLLLLLGRAAIVLASAEISQRGNDRKSNEVLDEVSGTLNLCWMLDMICFTGHWIYLDIFTKFLNFRSLLMFWMLQINLFLLTRRKIFSFTLMWSHGEMQVYCSLTNWWLNLFIRFLRARVFWGCRRRFSFNPTVKTRQKSDTFVTSATKTRRISRSDAIDAAWTTTTTKKTSIWQRKCFRSWLVVDEDED